MNRKLLGTALIAGSVSAFTSGCGILQNIEVPTVRFDSNSYVVQPGDTLNSVASRYKIDPDSLLNINSLELAELIPGQRLLLLRDEEVASMAAIANRTAGRARVRSVDSDVAIGGVEATAVGQSVVLPNATQTVAATSDATMISSDVKLPSREEEIIAVVDVSKGDALLDDQPIFVSDSDLSPLPAPSQVARPQGVETIVQTVNVGGDGELPAPVLQAQAMVPSAATVEIADADTSSARRITVNQRDKGWNWPVLGTITQDFDLKEINRQGLDIDPGPGAAVQAAADGEVVYSGRDLASYGNLVILRHENNFLSAYSKVNDIFVKENQKVKAGDLIAAVGQNESGSSEVHFEIRRNGEPVNPIDYLPAL